MDYCKLGLRIKEIRKKRRMSQQTLSYEIDYSIPHISHVENGTTKLSVDFLVKTANALQVTTDQLLCDSLDNSEMIFQGEIMESLKDCSNTELKIINRLIKDVKVNLRENIEMESGKNIQLLYDVGLRIKELRLENEWKQIELAKRIGVDRTSISSYERGKRIPDIFILCRIADEFGVTLDYLVGRSVQGE